MEGQERCKEKGQAKGSGTRQVRSTLPLFVSLHSYDPSLSG
jgi:hypothetical protein